MVEGKIGRGMDGIINGDTSEEQVRPVDIQSEKDGELGRGPGKDKKRGSSDTVEYRTIYQEKMRDLELHLKIYLAKTLGGNELSALCFDQSPRVIKAILENPKSGLSQARLIAGHHHTSAGLNFLTNIPAFVGDIGIRSSIFKNHVSSRSTLERCSRMMSLFHLHNLIVGSRGAEKNLITTRSILCDRFKCSDPGVCASFIIQTEGRCFRILGDVQLNAAVVKILKQQKHMSHLLKRNLLRLPALPADLRASIHKLK